MGNCNNKIIVTENMLTGEKGELEKLRCHTDEYSPSNMLQFQFLIGMQEDDRNLWGELFKKIDTSKDGLISEEEKGLSPKMLRLMCEEMLGGYEKVEGSRMVRLLEHFCEMEELKASGGGRTKHTHGTHGTHGHRHSHRRHSHSSKHSKHRTHKHKHKHGEEEEEEEEEGEEGVTPAGTPSGTPRESEGPRDSEANEEELQTKKIDLFKMMSENSSSPLIKFKFFVKAERKLRGEGIYHAGVTFQDVFRGKFLGEEYWGKRIEGYDDLIYSRDLWCMSDLYSFAVCGSNMPENYHDLNFEDGEVMREKERRKSIKHEEKERRKSIRKEEKEKKDVEKARRQSLKVLENTLLGAGENPDKENHRKNSKGERKKKRGEDNYSYEVRPQDSELSGMMSPQVQHRSIVGPGGLHPEAVLSSMPGMMRRAFQDQDVDMLKALEKGGDKNVGEREFWYWVHQAEDAGLWEPSGKKKG
ncbi:hypothetical protein TrLO_g293 [Triparma laevis f. longispina]|uniref:EF-hand domain-containing protein n=1 Tax=Triparma laevis f. longispina TaxID=1714387 RepID=A0A9W7KXI2_9STRA|nr:hypothetical protein TrLO_g293 [Triparma laevis f. longispina]